MKNKFLFRLACGVVAAALSLGLVGCGGGSRDKGSDARDAFRTCAKNVTPSYAYSDIGLGEVWVKATEDGVVKHYDVLEKSVRVLRNESSNPVWRYDLYEAARPGDKKVLDNLAQCYQATLGTDQSKTLTVPAP